MHTKRAITTARETLGDPTRMTPDQQHDTILRAVYSTIELAVMAGFRGDAAALASAEATVAFAANLSMASRQEVIAALRRCADGLEQLGEGEPLN